MAQTKLSRFLEDSTCVSYIHNHSNHFTGSLDIVFERHNSSHICRNNQFLTRGQTDLSVSVIAVDLMVYKVVLIG